VQSEYVGGGQGVLSPASDSRCHTATPVARRFVVLVDPEGLAEPLRRQLAAEPDPVDLTDFDAHAWDWLW
jgi:hypothetical protein